MKITFTISNLLIIVSCIFTLLTFVNDKIYIFGMHDAFYRQGEYMMWTLQMFSSQFLHGSLMHLLANSVFILYFGNVLERIIGSPKMLLFFMGNSIFLGLVLTFFGSGVTVGISGFALAVITYYTLLLWKKGNPEYSGGVTAIVLNVFIGLSPGISFLGHFGGMVFGALYWFTQEKKK